MMFLYSKLLFTLYDVDASRDRKLADIAPLLDVEDMVRMKSPDWKCVFTYVQSFYRHFEMQKQKTNAQ